MFVALLLFVIFLVVFHIFIYHKYNWPGYVKLINKIPGPSGIFYFGSTLRFYKLKNEGNGEFTARISVRKIFHQSSSHYPPMKEDKVLQGTIVLRNDSEKVLKEKKNEKALYVNEIFGELIKIMTEKSKLEVYRKLLYDIIDGFKKWGSTYRHWYSGVAVVFVSDLEDIQTVLSSRQNNCKGMLYKNILPWLGSGLLTSSGKKWHMMRKIITPTFHFSILHGYIDIFTKNANIMVKVLEKEANKKECDLPKFVTYCALDNVCETAMGTSVNALGTGNENKYVHAIFRMGQILVERMFSPLLFTDASFAFSSMGLEHKQLLKILHGFTFNIIQEKKQLNKAKKEPLIQENDDYMLEGRYKKKRSFLEMLLENQEAYSLSTKDIRQEVDTFMFEGHDTTSASLNWTLFLLGHHSEIQEQCYNELNKIFGDSNRSPSYQDLMEMSYLKRVIQEGLRLYPSVPVISRKFDVDIQLKDYLVPADTEIVLVLYGIHRNPQVFPNPENFDPDRFLPEEVEKRHPFAYIPFSAGQRNCVGQKFALLEELVVLSSIIRNFKVESLDEKSSVKVVPEMILRPHKKLRFKITRRTRYD